MSLAGSLLKVFDSLQMKTPKGKIVVKTDQQLEQFIKQLDLNEDGVDLYMLGYLGGCKKYSRFYRHEMEKAISALDKNKPLSSELNNKFEQLEGKNYIDFLGVVYDWVDVMLKDIQLHQPHQGQTNLRISGFQPTEGRTEMIDILQPLLDIIIQPKLKTDVYEHFIYFVINLKKRRLMRKDEVQFLPDFLQKYGSLKGVQTSSEDICYFPILYEDFIEYVQKNHKK